MAHVPLLSALLLLVRTLLQLLLLDLLMMLVVHTLADLHHAAAVHRCI
jgi:hypothetical protein